MIRETATAAEVYQTFCAQDPEISLKNLVAVIDEQLDYEKSFDLMIKCAEVSEGKIDKSAPIYERMMWVIRQAFLFGFAYAAECHYEAAENGYMELFCEVSQ